MKKIVYGLITIGLTFLLSACGESETKVIPEDIKVEPKSVVSGTNLTLEGQVSNWMQPAKSIVAFLGSTQATAPISAEGKFSIVATKPADVTNTLAFIVFCNAALHSNVQSNVTISNATSSHLLNLRVTEDSKGLHLSSFEGYSNIFNVPNGMTVTNVGFYYFTNAATVKGTESCLTDNFGNVELSYDLDIKEGWNTLVLTGTKRQDSLTISGKMGQIPTNVDWYVRK